MSFCPECGTDHHAGERNDSGKTAEVRIAEINAKRDVEVARIQRGETTAIVNTAAETDIAVAELETAAAVEVAAETDAPAAEDDPETTAIVVEGPPAETPEEDEPSMSPTDDSDIPEPEAPRKSSGYWP